MRGLLELGGRGERRRRRGQGLTLRQSCRGGLSVLGRDGTEHRDHCAAGEKGESDATSREEQPHHEQASTETRHSFRPIHGANTPAPWFVAILCIAVHRESPARLVTGVIGLKMLAWSISSRTQLRHRPLPLQTTRMDLCFRCWRNTGVPATVQPGSVCGRSRLSAHTRGRGSSWEWAPGIAWPSKSGGRT